PRHSIEHDGADHSETNEEPEKYEADDPPDAFVENGQDETDAGKEARKENEPNSEYDNQLGTPLNGLPISEAFRVGRLQGANRRNKPYRRATTPAKGHVRHIE